MCPLQTGAPRGRGRVSPQTGAPEGRVVSPLLTALPVADLGLLSYWVTLRQGCLPHSVWKFLSAEFCLPLILGLSEGCDVSPP